MTEPASQWVLCSTHHTPSYVRDHRELSLVSEVCVYIRLCIVLLLISVCKVPLLKVIAGSFLMLWKSVGDLIL